MNIDHVRVLAAAIDAASQSQVRVVLQHSRLPVAFAEAMLGEPLAMLEAFAAWSKARKELNAYEDGPGSAMDFIADDTRYNELWDAVEAARTQVMAFLSK